MVSLKYYYSLHFLCILKCHVVLRWQSWMLLRSSVILLIWCSINIPNLILCFLCLWVIPLPSLWTEIFYSSYSIKTKIVFVIDKNYFLSIKHLLLWFVVLCGNKCKFVSVTFLHNLCKTATGCCVRTHCACVPVGPSAPCAARGCHQAKLPYVPG